MRALRTSDWQDEMQQFFATSLRAILRAEAKGRVPERFVGTGMAVWETFRNELTTADLVSLCVQDAGVTMPVPFDPSSWWPDWPARALLRPSETDADNWLADAISRVDEPRDSYLSGLAATLGIDLPPEDAMAGLPRPERHERWLELPGTGGWVAYVLSADPQAGLYFWENFTVVCGTPQEMLFAGLIAWELGAPPHAALPIRVDDAGLTATLKSGETYHAIVARRDLHGHRNLRILHQGGEEPLWL